MTTTPSYRFPTKRDDTARADRLARVRAARSTTPTYGPEQTVPQSDLRTGDYVVRLTSPGFRSMAVGTILRSVHVTTNDAPFYRMVARFTFADDVVAGRGTWDEWFDAYTAGYAVIRRQGL